KMKVQTKAREVDRARPARKSLFRNTKVRHPPGPYRANMHVLNAQRILKSFQLDLAVPELEEWQARPRENQSPDLHYRRKSLQSVITLVSSRETPISER